MQLWSVNHHGTYPNRTHMYRESLCYGNLFLPVHDFSLNRYWGILLEEGINMGTFCLGTFCTKFVLLFPCSPFTLGNPLWLLMFWSSSFLLPVAANVPPCRREYDMARKALDEARLKGMPAMSAMLPHCRDDGYYHPKQCSGSMYVLVKIWIKCLN